MIRALLTTYLALNAAIPVTLGTLRAWHERGYRRNVTQVMGPAELRARLIDELMADVTYQGERLARLAAEMEAL